MIEPAIKVENISKKYLIGLSSAGTFRDYLTNQWSRFFHSVKSQKEEFWALQDVSFEIRQGEVFGIIGRNGAGKSTLLKIISRITVPSSGRVIIHGKVSSLLEVGTGFHHELTGRENILLNGTILGMSRKEIRQKLDEIIAFSGIEKFIDTPVKHYSSGMYVRLAFAVAAHLEPEILLIDEVLAVGDIEFQKKCLGKMNEVAREGRTILFVSHNMQAVSTLTNKCIVLEKGMIQFIGDTSSAIKEYLSFNQITADVFEAPLNPDKPSITRVEIVTSHPNKVHYHGKPFQIKIHLHTPHPLNNSNISFQIINEFEQPLIWLWVLDKELHFGNTDGTFQLTCRIPQLRLYKGKYRLIVNFSEDFGKKHPMRIENICPFEVVMYERSFEFDWSPNACVYFEDATWEVDK